jgi:hypothetical protein
VGADTKADREKPGAAGDGGPVANGANGTEKESKMDSEPHATDSTCRTDLPQPMLPDCKVVPGVVPAPDNFVLCSMHGHILDTATKQIVANNLKEFQAQHPEFGKLPMKMLADCVPESGKLSGPAHHVLCRTHGHVLDLKAKKVIAWSPVDYRKRFSPKKPTTGSETASPPFDEKNAQQTLRNVLSGASILIGDFQSRRADFNTKTDRLASLCADAVSAIRQAMAETDTSLHAHNEAAGHWIARSDLWVPGNIPRTCQDVRNALSKLSRAMNKLRECLDNPPPPPPPGPPPEGVDPDAYKAQRDLIRRRDILMASRAFEDGLQSLLDLGEKIDHELETAKNLATRLIFSHR